MFTDQLALTGAAWNTAADGASELWLRWQTAGPDPADWRGYRLEIAAGDQVTAVPFDAFRPPEWVPDGSFLTWHRVETPGARRDCVCADSSGRWSARDPGKRAGWMARGDDPGDNSLIPE